MNKIIFDQLNKIYLIAEIGINHNGAMDITKKLIDATNGCDWNAVKFQKRNPHKCVPEDQKNKLKETPWGTMTYLEYKNKIEFNKMEYDTINNYCKDKPLDWSVSVWDIDSLMFILNYEIPWIKIPSAKITDKELILETAKSQLPIILSTGMSTIEEIDNAVNELLKINNNILIMHCNSSYPAKNKDLNLNTILTLKQRYKLPIGYSGHEEDLEPTVVAHILGANVLERHITINHNMWGSDQKASLEVHAMNILQKRLINIKEMLGDGVKKLTEDEFIKRQQLRGN